MRKLTPEEIDFKKAEEFQDALGEWIADAINQKLESGVLKLKE